MFRSFFLSFGNKQLLIFFSVYQKSKDDETQKTTSNNDETQKITSNNDETQKTTSNSIQLTISQDQLTKIIQSGALTNSDFNIKLV